MAWSWGLVCRLLLVVRAILGSICIWLSGAGISWWGAPSVGWRSRGHLWLGVRLEGLGSPSWGAFGEVCFFVCGPSSSALLGFKHAGLLLSWGFVSLGVGWPRDFRSLGLNGLGVLVAGVLAIGGFVSLGVEVPVVLASSVSACWAQDWCSRGLGPLGFGMLGFQGRVGGRGLDLCGHGLSGHLRGFSSLGFEGSMAIWVLGVVFGGCGAWLCPYWVARMVEAMRGARVGLGASSVMAIGMVARLQGSSGQVLSE